MDYTNQKYNKWTFIKQTGNIKPKGNDKLWLCRCDCGYEREQVASQVVKGRTKMCKVCKLEEIRKKSKLKYSESSATEAFWNGRVLYNANSCDRRQVFITREEANELFIKQNQKCALTGLALMFPTKRRDPNATASLDRIDSEKPYEKNNVQWVHKKINKMKMDLPQEEFIFFCKLVAENN